MNTSPLKIDGRVEAVYFTRNSLVVDLMDGRTISVPLTWYPKLLKATLKERAHWEICGGGYGIHWPELDEDLSIEGLLRGSSVPNPTKAKLPKKPIKQKIVYSIKRARVKRKAKVNK